MADEWEFRAVAPGISPCGFCKQPVEPAERRPCMRCRAVYHPDCWRANDSRCAIYGCDPVPLPTAPALPPVPVRAEPLLTSPRGGGRWNMALIAVAFLAITNLMRLLTPMARPEVHLPPTQGVASAGLQDLLRERREAQDLIIEARPVLAEIGDGCRLPQDAPSRDRLRRRVEEASGNLVRAREIYRKMPRPWNAEDVSSRIRELSLDLEKLRSVSRELGNP
jgi:hypothetical protein